MKIKNYLLLFFGIELYFLLLFLFCIYIFWPRNNPAIEYKIQASYPVKKNNLDLIAPTPSQTYIETLKENIKSILGNQVDNYGVYFYDLKRGLELGINQNKIFPPMSISKVPVGLIIMREIEKENFSLNSTFAFNYSALASPTNVLDKRYIGTYFSIADYLRLLIVDSDNSAMLMLENLLGGTQEVNRKVREEFGIKNFSRNPHEATAKSVGLIFKGLYNNDFLSLESNDYFFNLLKNTHFNLQDGIPASVPDPYKSKIAHKTGQGSSVPGYIWSDSGIIFGKNTDYILVILNEKININQARSNIQQISKLIWETTQTEI